MTSLEFSVYLLKIVPTSIDRHYLAEKCTPLSFANLASFVLHVSRLHPPGFLHITDYIRIVTEARLSPLPMPLSYKP